MTSAKNIGDGILRETIDGIDFVWMPSKKYKANNYLKRTLNLFLFWRGLMALELSQIAESKTIAAIIASSPSLLSGHNGFRWAKKYELPFVFEVRDLWPMSLVALTKISALNPLIMLFRRIEKLAYRKADAVVSLLPLAKEYMKTRGLEEKKFHYIPNGIYIEENEPNEEAQYTREKELPQNKFIIGYIGSFGIANDLPTLLNTAELLENNNTIHFVLVGDGPIRDDLMRSYGHLNNVSFVDRIAKNETLHMIRAFDVGYVGLKNVDVFKYGVSPNKLFEYMFCKKPIIQAINTNFDIVAEAKCGISIKTGDPLHIKDAILEILSLPARERENMGERGKEYVVKHHIYPVIGRKYMDLITDISK